MLSTSVHQQSNATLVQVGQTVSCHFRDFPSAADGFVNSGLSSPDEERSKPATLVPKSQVSTRRSSTKSKTSRKSGKSEDAKSDAAASPPAGWTIGQAPADDVVVAPAPASAETADAHIADDDFCLPELSDLGGKELEPPTPMHPNLDIYSREHSTMAFVQPPVGAALPPFVEGLSGERTPNVASTLSEAPALSGVREAPTPMKPNLDVFSRERSPYVPASPRKPPTPPL